MLLLLILILLLCGGGGWRYGGPGISLGTIVLILILWYLLVGFAPMPHYRW